MSERVDNVPVLILTGECSLKDYRVYNASRFLLKVGEHTLGLNSVRDTVNWTNAAFERAKSGIFYVYFFLL